MLMESVFCIVVEEGEKNSESTDSWTSALDLLRLNVSPKKTPHCLYRDDFAQEQDSKTPTDIFVYKLRLTKRHSERNNTARYARSVEDNFRDILSKHSIDEKKTLETKPGKWFVNDRAMVKVVDDNNSMQDILAKTVDVHMVHLVIQMKFNFIQDTQVMLELEEGASLSSTHQLKFTLVLMIHENIFKLGRGTTPFAEFQIDTEDHLPMSVPPYRTTLNKKEVLCQELDEMLEEEIIQACESAWPVVVVLVSKKYLLLQLP
ncbi:hypothetical protein FQA39_LY08195 [Lamprigera yunnana]|nr:hypothetical protein FQA39_LY08195 [Lamprigera yunnana]